MTIVTFTIKNYLTHYSGLNRFCWQGIILGFIEAILAAIYYFLSIYFVDVLHINISIAGMMISCYGLGTIIGGYIGGKLSDNISPQTVTMMSLLSQAITFLVLIKIVNPTWIAIDLFILGIATYSFLTSNSVFTLAHCKNSGEDKLKVINILAVASNLGMGLAALIIGELAEKNFQYIFYSSGSLLLILAIWLMFQPKQLIKNENQPTLNKNLLEENLSESAKINANNKGLILAFICLFFTGMIVSQLSTTYSIYLKESFPQMGMHAFSFFFFLNTCLVVIFQNSLVNQFSNYNKLIMIGVGSFLIGFGMLLLNFSFFFFIALLSCVIYSAGEMIFFSIVQLFCYQQGRDDRKGSSLGAYRMVYASSRFIGPTVGGSIYYYLGRHSLWYISGLIGFVFLLLCNHFRKLS
ncbi:MAG: MFS transporter [Gammaproteobacteria bacterium]|nr:MFS transporter [Gammaproteobacteria bacterium]